MLRLSLATDQVDASNLASLEAVTRRLVQIEMATAKNPRAPDFVGLGIISDSLAQADGSSRVPKFRQRVAERQKERAQILKQNRLYSEELRGRGKGKGKGKKNQKSGRGAGEEAES